MEDALFTFDNKLSFYLEPLEEYEDKLHLIEKFVHIRDKIRTIDALVHTTDTDSVDEILSQISVISNDILEEL